MHLSMGIATISVAVENLFSTNWGTTTPIRYDNVPFTPPQTAWVSIETWPGNSSKASLGNSLQLRRSLGTVFISVYTPIGDGSKPARDLADQVAAIFRDKQVSGITFQEPDMGRVGEIYYAATGSGVVGTTQWYQAKVAVPFFYDETI